jgi:DtxR family Mn-dependent transcriptional regulator
MSAGTVDKRDGTTPREREYLEVIYYLTARGEPVIAARIADWLKVAAPTVSNMLQRLLRREYITRDEGGAISLTPHGLQLAEAIVRQHRLLECFLVDVMGMPWESIHEEAVQLERNLSERFQERIEQVVGNAPTCPHGNPVPGNRDAYDGRVRLDQAPPGGAFEIKRIVEEAEEDTELMAFLYHHGVTPGKVVTVQLAADRFGGGGVLLQPAQGETVVLTHDIAASIWGEPR